MTTREASDIQEKRIAKHLSDFGCKKVSGSGSGDWQKGDCKTDDLFIEAKTSLSPKSSFSIKLDWLKKAKEQAFSMGKFIYTLVFCFGDDVDWYTVDSDTFKEFYRCYKAVERLDYELENNKSLSIDDVKEILK